MEKEKWDESNIPDQRNKVFIVTGPTSGLGFDTSRILAKKNAIVIMAARDVRKAEKVKKSAKKVIENIYFILQFTNLTT